MSARVSIPLVALLSSVLFGAEACGARSPLGSFARYVQQPSTGGRVTVRFFGTTSLLFKDQETAILSDGFVSRPKRGELALPIRPDEPRVDSALQRLGMPSIAAIFTGHSHYDHAMDAPVFAERTHAVLLGSASTKNIGLGWKLPETQLHVIHDGETCRFGRFELTFVESAHSPVHPASGVVDGPLVPPAWVTAWKSDSTWSVFIRHDQRTLLVHGSANFKRGALAGRHADVVYLGIGALGTQSDAFVNEYWSEVVGRTGAKRVILVHWDDFFRSLDEPLRPLRSPFDSFPRAMQRILRHAEAAGVEVLLPILWEPTDPFAGLP